MAGDYRVEFQIGLAAVPPGRIGDFPCATIDVYANTGATLIKERNLRVSQLGPELRTIKLDFRLQEPRNVGFG